MNKVITINLNGQAYQLEEDGFEALRRYLDSAARQLDGNPDKAEIIADIEQSIGDKFRAMIGPSKNVVVTKEVADVIAEMGPVQDASGERSDSADPSGGAGRQKDEPAGAPAGGTQTPPRRLYRIREGAKIGGVCNGLAAYFGIEVTVVRLLFVFVALTFGAGVLLYFIMMFVIPPAETPAEKAEAFGAPSTAEEFIRRAKAGYYGGMRTFRDKKAYREWKWQFKRDVRRHSQDFKREMQQNIHQWSHDWRQHWGRPRYSHDSWVAGSFFSLLITIVSVLGFCAILSLILTGSIFTYTLPAGIPLWVGIVLLFLIFHIIKWPLKAARHSMYYNGADGPHYGGPWMLFGGTFWSVAIIVSLVWFSSHHSARTHEILDEARHQSHLLVDSIRDWWNKP
jgi:phage shock protein PspC (stress-responsive transcriptional regulator)